MLRSEAIAIIKRGLGYRQTQDASIIAALQEAQRILELGHTLPDWLLTFDNAITVTADAGEITLPTGFIRLHDDYDMYYVNTDNAKVFLPRRNYTEAYQAYVANGSEDDSPDNTDADYPSVFVLKNKTSGLLIPTPTQSFTAYLTCYSSGEPLTTDVENAWLANSPDVLIGMAGTIVAGNVRDKDALATFGQRANVAGRSHMGDIVEQELAGRGLMMGRNN